MATVQVRKRIIVMLNCCATLIRLGSYCIISTIIIPAAEADDRSMIGTIYRTQLFFRLLFNSQYRLYWNDALCVWKHSLPSRDELVTASIRNCIKRHFPSVLVSNNAEIPSTQPSKKRPSVSGVRVLEERWH